MQGICYKWLKVLELKYIIKKNFIKANKENKALVFRQAFIFMGDINEEK